MSLWTRIGNLFHGERLSSEIDEEIQSHIIEAIELGRDPIEARRAFGAGLRRREESRDMKLIAWIDSLRADAIFGCRRLNKNKVTSAAAILSLALAIGACTSAFRLIDAVLLRPLPVAHPERLYEAGSTGIDLTGTERLSDDFAYPLFQQMRAAVKDRAELIAISDARPKDLTFGSDDEMEKVNVQYVSGWMFGTFGIGPAVGRLFTEGDDLKPGAHPVAVLSFDFWKRRFGQDPKVVGRTFQTDGTLYEIVGVSEMRFTGTEPGTIPDIFLPTMMNSGVTHSDWSWFRTFAQVKPGVRIEPLRAHLQSLMSAFNGERAKGFTGMPQQAMDRFLSQKFVLEPAASGSSYLQESYRTALIALGVLVALVLLIACANVANLMMGQAAARGREMALRVSIGAERRRLVQLVMMEGAWLGLLSTALGGIFAWWAAPFVVRMINPPDNPVRLILPADWRVLGFGAALAFGVTILFGLAPAMRASNVKPATALKGGEDSHSRRRFMNSLIAAQVAFCFLVLFVAGLFAASFERLTNRPLGFSADRILTLDTIANQPQAPGYWDQVAEHLRITPGVEKVSLAGWALLSGNGWNGFIMINGGPPSLELAHFLNVSPGWLDEMKIPLIAGRDFRASDTSPGTAIVNEAFVNTFFRGENPVGRTFEKTQGNSGRIRFEIVGVAGNARYRNLREPITPMAYVPFQTVNEKGAMTPQRFATIVVRTTDANPRVLATVLRKEVALAMPGFRVSEVHTQLEINQSHTVRERMLSTLAIFFASVALLLAGVGLYGVLHYSVVQRRREIGIRIAVGAQAGDVARLVTWEILFMILTGAVAGLALGLALERYIDSLLYGVKATSAAMIVLPALTILAAALLAALPAVIQAVRIDPVRMLRSE